MISYGKPLESTPIEQALVTAEPPPVIEQSKRGKSMQQHI